MWAFQTALVVKKKTNNLENPMDRGALEGYSPWGRKEWDTTEQLTHTPVQET